MFGYTPAVNHDAPISGTNLVAQDVGKGASCSAFVGSMRHLPDLHWQWAAAAGPGSDSTGRDNPAESGSAGTEIHEPPEITRTFA